MASIGELPYAEFWGPHPNLDSEKKMNLPPVFTSFKQRRKRKFKMVFVQVVKKRALDVQNLFLFFFFHFLFGLIAVAVAVAVAVVFADRCSQDLSMCLSG